MSGGKSRNTGGPMILALILGAALLFYVVKPAKADQVTQEVIHEIHEGYIFVRQSFSGNE